MHVSALDRTKAENELGEAEQIIDKQSRQLEELTRKVSVTVFGTEAAATTDLRDAQFCRSKIWCHAQPKLLN